MPGCSLETKKKQIHTISRAKTNKYREVISKQSQVQMYNGLKNRAEIHDKVVRNIPRSMNDQVYSGFWYGAVFSEGLLDYILQKVVWTVSSFMDNFIVMS